MGQDDKWYYLALYSGDDCYLNHARALSVIDRLKDEVQHARALEDPVESKESIPLHQNLLSAIMQHYVSLQEW